MHSKEVVFIEYTDNAPLVITDSEILCNIHKSLNLCNPKDSQHTADELYTNFEHCFHEWEIIPAIEIFEQLGGVVVRIDPVEWLKLRNNFHDRELLDEFKSKYAHLI